MEIKNNKEEYISPEVTILVVKTEGMLCMSGGDFPGWDEEEI